MEGMRIGDFVVHKRFGVGRLLETRFIGTTERGRVEWPSGRRSSVEMLSLEPGGSCAEFSREASQIEAERRRIGI